MPDVRRPRRGALPAVLALVLLVAPACQGDAPEPGAEPTPSGTPLTAFDTTGLVVARASFCSRVAPAAARAALGAEAESTAAYDNGEPARLGGGAKDVAHEFGCAWTAEDGAAARAWVFAPPVTPARARELGELARAGTGCRADDDAPRFGKHSVALVCTDGPRVTASYRGLFGDAWLTCTLEEPASRVDEAARLGRAGSWCVAVARAAAGAATGPG